MAYRSIAKNDPRYDSSSIIVSVENEELEAESCSYGDDITLSKVRAMFARLAVGEAEGLYEAAVLEMTMHRDAHQGLLVDLKQKANGGPVNRVPVTITVSYSERGVNPGETLPQLTDTLYGCRYLGTKHGHNVSADPLKVTARFSVHIIKWHGDIFLGPSEKGGDVFAGATRFFEELTPWNTMKMDGEPFPSERAPCIVVVDAPVKYATDKKKSRGRDGRKIVTVGYMSATVTLTLKIWTRPQWDAFCEKLKVLHPKFNPDRRNGRAVSSEILDKYFIGRIYIDEIGSPTEAEPGVLQVVMKASEVYEGDKKDVTKKVTTQAGRDVPTNQRVDLRSSSIPKVGGLGPQPGETDQGDE